MFYKVTVAPAVPELEQPRVFIVEATSVEEAGCIAIELAGGGDSQALHVDPIKD